MSFNWSPVEHFTATFTYTHDEVEAHPIIPLQNSPAGSDQRATFNREFVEVENDSYSLAG